MYSLPLPQSNYLAWACNPTENPIPCQQSTSKIRRTSMSSWLEPSIWSCDTGHCIPCFDSCQLIITWMSDIKDVPSNGATLSKYGALHTDGQTEAHTYQKSRDNQNLSDWWVTKFSKVWGSAHRLLACKSSTIIHLPLKKGHLSLPSFGVCKEVWL